MNLNWRARALSWSSVSAFIYSKEGWYKRYILGEKQDPTPEMEFGKLIGEKLELDPTFMPEIPRLSKMEQPFRCKLGELEICGYADTFDDKTFKRLGEYKTGHTKWTKKRVDDHGQLTMYCLMNYLINNIPPEEVEIRLIWMPTYKDKDNVMSLCGNVKKFKTKRTMSDILKFAALIKNTYKEMNQYVDNYLQ